MEAKPSRTSQQLREAKALAVALRANLGRKGPADEGVELQRQSLRSTYLALLFGPTKTARVGEVLNALWLDTAHVLISDYRAKLAQLDLAIAAAPVSPRGVPHKARPPPAPGHTARRRLVASFRAFLAKEEAFFSALLARFAHALAPSHLAGLRALGVQLEDTDPDDDSIPTPDEQHAIRDRIVPLAHKALICFGDLARYREQYRDVPSVKKDGAGQQAKRAPDPPKNWQRAAECYHQARLLLPDNGNPSNQLAVLANYANDNLSSSYHYYRALSVRDPFPTARTNLDVTYTKILAKWLAPGGSEIEGDEGVRFRAAFVALNGMFYLRREVNESVVLEGRVERLFRISVEQRLLSSDLIVKTVVTGLCALWNARIYRAGGKASKVRSPAKGVAPPVPVSTASLEPDILIHVLSLYRILLSVGAAETDEQVAANRASSSVDLDDPKQLATNISAVLRRTLPAIRIMSKWIMGQLEYLNRTQARVVAYEVKMDAAAQEIAERFVRPEVLRRAILEFWAAYAAFANSMQSAFPLERLPSSVEGSVWLEEDVDMLGFQPLRRGMKEGVGANDGTPFDIPRVGGDVHPNEEQLMRISEIQQHALLIARSEASPVQLNEGVFSVPSYSAEVVASPRAATRVTEQEFEGLEDMTEDDPVDLAMRVAESDRMMMDGDDDEDDEEIVYQSLNSSAQLLPPPASLMAPARTAGDLLQSLLAGTPTSTRSSLPPPGMSTPPAARSIWAVTNGSSALPLPGAAISSFESLPNLTTRQAFDAPLAARNNATPPISSPMAARGSPSSYSYSRALPPPASFANSQANSDLSPHANPFSDAPRAGSIGGGNATGWPDSALLQPLPPPPSSSRLASVLVAREPQRGYARYPHDDFH